jgi:hypothetical protein
MLHYDSIQKDAAHSDAGVYPEWTLTWKAAAALTVWICFVIFAVCGNVGGK